MKNKVLKIIGGYGTSQDINDLLEWGKVLKASRCGLGQTAGNPIINSVINFRYLYESYINRYNGYSSQFNLNEAVQEFCRIVKRKPEINFHD